MKNTKVTKRGLYFTIFWLPFINIIMYIGMLISFFSSLNKIKLFEKKKFLDYFILFFILIVFISVLTSMNKILSIYGFIAFCAYPIAYFIFAGNLSEENFPKIIRLILISASIVIIFGVVQPLIPNSVLYRNDKLFINLQTWEGKGRVTSTLGHPNVLAAYLVLILPVILCLFLQKPSFKIGALFILGLICLFFTSSRAAWIGAGVSLILLFIIRKKIILLLISALFLILLLVLPGLSVSFKNILDPSTYGERFFAWRTSLNIVYHRPLTGTGINTFYEIYPKFQLPDAKEKLCHAHNVFLHIGAETGLLGMGIFCVILILFFNMFWKVYRRVSTSPGRNYEFIVLGFIAGVTGFIVHNLGDYLFSNGQVGVLFWSIMGLIRGLERMQNLNTEL